MRFIPFLDKIPQKNRQYLGKEFTQDSWLPIVFVYWGLNKGEHMIQEQHGCYLEAKTVIYLDEAEVEEYEAVEVEGDQNGAFNIKRHSHHEK